MTNPVVTDDGVVERIEFARKMLGRRREEAMNLGGYAEFAVEEIEAVIAALASSDRDVLVGALRDAREAIASLDTEALGMGQLAFGELGVDVYPIRDELLAKIDAALIPLAGEV